MRCFRHAPRWLVWLLVIGMIPASGGVVWAQESAAPTSEAVPDDAQAALQRGIERYNSLDWDEAVTALQKAIRLGLPNKDRAQAYWHLAIIARARDEMQDAEDDLFEMLRADPTFALPESLRGTDFEPLFAAAQARTDRTPPVIRILPLENVKAGQPITVGVRVSDDSEITGVELVFRLPNAKAPTVIAMTRKDGDRWAGTIPADAVAKGKLLAYQVRATDAWQNVGTQSATVSASKGGRGFVLYGLLGSLVAIGGGIAAYLLGTNGTPTGTVTDGGTTGPWPQSSAPLPPEM